MTQKKDTISLKQLCYAVSEFFGLTRTHDENNSWLNSTFKTHKKADGHNIVLLVSNGLSLKNESYPTSFRILKKSSMSDCGVIKNEGDRSALIYEDLVTSFSHVKSTPQHFSMAKLFKHQDYSSDTVLLNEVLHTLCLDQSKPKFITALLSGSFLTTKNTFTKDINNIDTLIEHANSTGTLYLLTSLHQLATLPDETKKENSYTNYIKPLVPLYVVAEALRHRTEKSPNILWQTRENKTHPHTYISQSFSR